MVHGSATVAPVLTAARSVARQGSGWSARRLPGLELQVVLLVDRLLFLEVALDGFDRQVQALLRSHMLRSEGSLPTAVQVICHLDAQVQSRFIRPCRRAGSGERCDMVAWSDGTLYRPDRSCGPTSRTCQVQLCTRRSRIEHPSQMASRPT